jgi:1,4-dihydroxy-2-naphthoate octaprenyltransferase
MLAQAATPSSSRYAPLPFVLAGLAPFGVGTLLAGVSGFPLRWEVLAAGVVAIGALIKATFASRAAFTPGAGRCPSWGELTPDRARRQAYLSLLVAALMGLFLQVWCRTGDLTIPLGGLGILGGYFYFAPPLKWHRRGWGEVVGALCFGLLPVTAGLYLQCGHLLSEVLLYGLPLTFAGFNLFLIYGFPQAGPVSAPHSLPARLRPVTGALIFTIVNILTMVGLAFIWLFPAAALPLRALLWPLLLLAVVNQELVKRKAYGEESRLRRLGHLALTLHLGMGLIFILMLWQRL